MLPNTEPLPKPGRAKPLLEELTEEQKAAIKLAYWKAPEDADFEQEAIALAYGYSLSWLQFKRSHGGGPLFRKIGRKVLYKKRDVVAYFDTQTVRSTSQYVSN